jgi:hypothetical protein
MKRVIIIVTLIMLSLFAGAQLPQGEYLIEDQERTLRLAKGWNILPLSENISGQGSTCSDPLAVFMWNPDTQSYINFAAVDADTYPRGSHTMAWFYFPNECEVTLKYKDDFLTGENPLILKSGWNFVSIVPWMENKSQKDILSNCTLEKANFWDAPSQDWLLSNSTQVAEQLTNSSRVYINDTGEHLVVNVESDCSLNSGPTITAPPALPE